MTLEPRKQPTYIPMVVMLCSALAMFLLAVGYTGYSVRSSQQQWCQSLLLLTKAPVPKPADPAKNPSREEAYTLYNAFSVLKKKYGCD